MNNSPIENLTSGYHYHLKKEPDYILNSRNKALKQKNVRASLRNVNITIGLFEYFVNHNIEAAKSRFYIVGLLSEYLNNHYRHPWLAYGFSYFIYVFLSDNIHLIKRMGSLSIHPDMEPAKSNESCIVFALMSLIREDWDEVEFYIKVIKNLNQKSKASPYLKLHIRTLEAFIQNDLEKLESSLKSYDAPQLKSNRKKVKLEEHFISFMPLGFAKLAWLKGMNVEVESQYIPKDLLLVKPLNDYKIPYWFLEDYYKDQGINI